MAIRNFSNTTAKASLTAPCTATDVNLSVSGFTNTPTVPFTVTLDRNTASEEIVLVTALAGSTLSVTRGFDGTAATSHLAGASVEHTAGAIDFREANAHVNASTGVHGTTGALVGAAGSQSIQDKTLVSPVLQADNTLGDAAVASVVGAAARNLFRGIGTSGSDVFIVDGTGRVTGATATAPEHLASKGYVDNTAGTAAVTNGALVRRDSTGWIGVAGIYGVGAPVGGTDVVTKSYADALGTAAATASTIARRDASGRLAVATPSATGDAATKGYVDGLTTGPKGRVARATATATVSGAANSSGTSTLVSTSFTASAGRNYRATFVGGLSGATTDRVAVTLNVGGTDLNRAYYGLNGGGVPVLLQYDFTATAGSKTVTISAVRDVGTAAWQAYADTTLSPMILTIDDVGA